MEKWTKTGENGNKIQKNGQKLEVKELKYVKTCKKLVEKEIKYENMKKIW